ncbi:exonuclease [Ectobacillus panaciterrae]|uniref:exonuclease n=1 Tax=Ectobacillus panaciterrae TaxID=363872 RepID=UPI0004028FFE|nr:exonuclease [Ectobacillus panaciterrae]
MYEPKFYIVFDIERNFRPYQSDAPTEIVDIGAIKIEANTMSMIEFFSALVKPTASLSRHTTKLTGITKEDVKGAESFPQVIEKFREFVGEDYMFVTWGKEDYGFLTKDCVLHDTECPYLGKEVRFDLQRFVFHAYQELFPNQPNLKFAVEQLALEWEGEQHRAYADAKNTANIFLTAIKQKDIHKSYKRNIEFVFVKEGSLTDKGKKIMKRWVFKELKRTGVSQLTWDWFINSKTWENVSEQYHFNDITVLLLQNYFPTALKKSQQQLQILAAMNSQENQTL